MIPFHRRFVAAVAVALVGLLVTTCPAVSADLGPQPRLAEPAPSNPWQFSFTPYGWMLNVNGNVTARGHTVDVNDTFFQIVEKSDSLLAWMSYFEARKGPFSLFTDVVWADLGFPGHAQDDFNRQASGHPFERFPAVGVSTTLKPASMASTIHGGGKRLTSVSAPRRSPKRVLILDRPSACRRDN
jgi:hypothetical protein